MGKGYSLHIGLNEVSRKRYFNKFKLNAPENDAKAMQGIADMKGFKSTLLLTQAATAGAVISYISKKSAELVSGDYLLITFSGHGRSWRDYAPGEDEQDGRDETWCLYDRMLIDDEIYLLCSRFAKGIRILFISDSCHSGTVLELMSAPQTDNINIKTIPEEAMLKAIDQTPSEYSAAKFLAWSDREIEAEASIELLAACQDEEKAFDGTPYSYFTEHILKVWQDGAFEGSLPEFYLQIKNSMNAGPLHQVPQRLSLGRPHPKFSSGDPFAI